MPRRNTWKSDKRANDHSSVLSHAVGKKIEVVNTRTKGKGLDGVITSEGSDRFVRRSNESFETTLTTAMRGKSEVDFTLARRVLGDGMERYRQKWRDYNIDRRNRGLPDYQGTPILHATQNAKHIAVSLHQYLDTLRCATKANEFFLRTDCVDNAVDSIIKSVKNECAKMESDALHEKAMHFMSMLFGTVVPTPVWHKDVVDVAIKWTRATYDMIDSGNAKDCVTVSIGIAIDLMHLITPKAAPPPPPPSDDPPEDPSDEESDEESDVDSNPEAPSDKPDEQPDDQPDEQPQSDKGDKPESDQPDDTNPDTGTGDTGTLDISGDLGELLDVAEKTTGMKKSEEYASDDVKHYEKSSDGVNHKTMTYTFSKEMAQKNASARVVNLLQDTQKMGMSHRHRTGMPTTDVWKISALGDTKVFGKSDHRSGKLVILLDLSGSMVWESQYDGSKADLAIQSTIALQEAFPQAETFGFASDSKMNYIVPMQSGIFPSEKSYGIPVGNPDCCALLHIQDMLSGQMQDSMAIIVSDGYPAGPSPMADRHMRDHTRELAKKLHNDGLRFASVLIQTPSTIYPSDVVARVYQVDDIYDIGEVIHRVGQKF